MDTLVRKGYGIDGLTVKLDLNDIIVLGQFRQAIASLRQQPCPDGCYSLRAGDVIDLNNFLDRLLVSIPALKPSNAFKPLSPEEREEAERELSRK